MSDNSTQNGTDTISTDAITTLNGASIATGEKMQRVKVEYGDDNTARDVSPTYPLPVALRDITKTPIQLWANGAAAGATGVETLISLTRSGAAGAATSAATTFVPSSGKRFRITSITFASRGNATATAQVTTFSLRVNTGGAVVATSNVMISGRTATPATALAYDRLSIMLEDAGLEIAGDGTLNFGISANAVFTTNAPTWDVLVTGYEYTP